MMENLNERVIINANEGAQVIVASGHASVQEVQSNTDSKTNNQSHIITYGQDL